MDPIAYLHFFMENSTIPVGFYQLYIHMQSLENAHKLNTGKQMRYSIHTHVYSIQICIYMYICVASPKKN